MINKLLIILIVIMSLWSIRVIADMGMGMGMVQGAGSGIGGPATGDGLLLETGDYLLLETGDYFLLE